MVCQRTNSTVQVTVCIREIVVVVDISEVEHIFGLTTIGNRYIVCVTSEVQTMQEKINHSLDFRLGRQFADNNCDMRFGEQAPRISLAGIFTDIALNAYYASCLSLNVICTNHRDA